MIVLLYVVNHFYPRLVGARHDAESTGERSV